MKDERQGGCYLYGFTGAQPPLALGAIGVPCEGRPGDVSHIVVGDVAALISPYSGTGPVPPLRRNLAPHHQVLRLAAEQVTVIPMRFGHIARSREAVAEALSRHQGALLAELRRLDGRVEMALSADLEEENPFAYLIERDPALKALRDKLFEGGRSPSHAERLELGRRCEASLQAERRAVASVIGDALRGVVIAAKDEAPRLERRLLRQALLLPRTAVEDFEGRLRRAAAALPASLRLQYSGPLAPMSFVDLQMEGEPWGS